MYCPGSYVSLCPGISTVPDGIRMRGDLKTLRFMDFWEMSERFPHQDNLTSCKFEAHASRGLCCECATSRQHTMSTLENCLASNLRLIHLGRCPVVNVVTIIAG